VSDICRLQFDFWQTDRACITGKMIGSFTMWLVPLVLVVLAQANSAAPPSGSTIAGSVIGPDGRPVAGALILLPDDNHPGGKAPTQAKTTTDSQGRFREDVIVALGLIDPGKAVELLERLPEPTDAGIQQMKNHARVKFARMLCRTGDRRWDHLQWHHSHLWVPDVEDLVGEF
jgi:hypothetical protein